MSAEDRRASSADGEEAARSLAVRLTEFFLQEGWDAVADPIKDPAGRPAVEVRSAESFGPMPGRFAPHRARFPVEPERGEAQFKDLTEVLRATRVGSPSGIGATTRPVLPEWCLTE
jgi:hypothetical protein